MKKTIALCIALSISAAILCSCSGGTDSTNPGNSSQSETDAKIKDCKVGSIIIDTDHSAYNPEQPTIILPGGVVINH